jgi:hypothetical protein
LPTAASRRRFLGVFWHLNVRSVRAVVEMAGVLVEAEGESAGKLDVADV